MILLWGVTDDGPLAAVKLALERRNAPVFHLDQRLTAQTSVELSLADGHLSGTIDMSGVRCALADITSVYIRPFDVAALLDPTAEKALFTHAERVEATLRAFLDATPALLVNPPAAMASNGSKPYQAALIARHGFRIPDTLVTTDPAAAAEFRARHGAIIYKSVSGVRSIVSRLTDAHADRLADIAWCPTQFQEHVTGRDVRVHVIGDRLFACEIAAEVDDYRYAHRQNQTISVTEARLSDEIAERCHRLATALGLPLAGIDLRRTPNGEWYCFEVNPSPAFTYYEDLTGLPMTKAAADLLMRRLR